MVESRNNRRPEQARRLSCALVLHRARGGYYRRAMSYVDTTTYDKAKLYKPGYGYSLREGKPSAIVVHSTSNPTQRNTAFTSEATYLLTAPKVSSHYLIGKDGRIVRFLEPAPWAAWHAGECVAGWANEYSIGIELHHSVGDAPYPQAQKAALAWLLKDLSQAFAIAPSRIDTHAQIALPGPYDRKHDPHDWSRADFLTWRNALFTPVIPAPNPLATHSLPGPDGRKMPCGEGFHRLYAERGGFAVLGYALTGEVDGQDCTWLRCERAVLKYSTPYGLELAQLEEAKRRGWI
jgi:hypothetical protein